MEDLAVADRLVEAGWSHHRLVRMKVDLCRAEVMLAAGDREGTVALASGVRSEVDRAGLGPTTTVGARLQRFEQALRSGT